MRCDYNYIWMYFGNGWQVFMPCCRAFWLPDCIFLTDYYLFHGKNEPFLNLLLNHCNYHRTKLNNAFCKLEMKDYSVSVLGRYLTCHFAAFLGWNRAAINTAPHKYTVLRGQDLRTPSPNEIQPPERQHPIRLQREGRQAALLSCDRAIRTGNCHCGEG